MKKKAKAKHPGIPADLQAFAEPLDSLEPDPKNARTHDEANVRAIAASLKEFGQVGRILVNSRNRRIVIGNGRYLAAVQLGWTHLAVRFERLTDKQHRALSIADNRTAELAGWDDTLLDEFLSEIQVEQSDLYDDLLLAELRVEDAEEEGQEEVEIPEGWHVVVECKDEKTQTILYERLTGEGFQCRLVVL